MSDDTVYIVIFYFFFFNDTATTEIYTLSLHDALPISAARRSEGAAPAWADPPLLRPRAALARCGRRTTRRAPAAGRPAARAAPADFPAAVGLAASRPRNRSGARGVDVPRADALPARRRAPRDRGHRRAPARRDLGRTGT